MEEEKKQVFSWPPLESDPAILTEYMQTLGMSKDWQLAEVLGLEPELLPMVPKDTTALVLTYDYTGPKAKEKPAEKCADKAPDKAAEVEITKKAAPPAVDYYMIQTGDLDNACGLIACIHAIFNNLGKVGVVPGSKLDNFLKKSMKQTPEERAKSLNDFKEIQEVHQQCGLEGQSKFVEEETKYHFICFIRNSKGQLVELDGIAGQPILIKGTFLASQKITTCHR